jgi:hypothetical protein
MSKTKRVNRGEACGSCGRPWGDHPGIMATCARLRNARGALKVICTWASFRGGAALQPEHVEKLCRKALNETA